MLTALYESWVILLSVMLVVPLGLVCAVAAVLPCCRAAVLPQGRDNDVFFKVGLITIVGLSAKNAILIVEFTRASCATATACRARSSRPLGCDCGRC